jgi:hypothetical protein
MYVLLIDVCPFVLFPLAIVLSVLLLYTDSDYPLVASNSPFNEMSVISDRSVLLVEEI